MRDAAASCCIGVDSAQGAGYPDPADRGLAAAAPASGQHIRQHRQSERHLQLRAQRVPLAQLPGCEQPALSPSLSQATYKLH